METNKNKNQLFADWMEGKISDEEVKKLLDEKEFLDFLKLRKSLDVLAELEKPLDPVYSQIKSKLHDTKTKKIALKRNNKYKNLFKIFVPVAAALLLFFAVDKYFTPDSITYQTAYGENIQLNLPDGSEVVLGPKSKLTYKKSEWKKQRRVYLEGEAFFKVKNGNTFIVDTKNGNVSVLGTQFEVLSRDNLFKVFCFEGKIKVQTPEVVDILSPGKGLIKTDEGYLEIHSGSELPGWISGQSSFEKTPLKYVLDAMESTYSIGFVLNDIDINQDFTGAFPHDNLSLALASVFKPLGIQYTKKGNKIILSVSKK